MDLQDPGAGNPGRRDLPEIQAAATCTAVCGDQARADMAAFAHRKLDFARGFLKLEYGVPSHDTFSRVSWLLDPAQICRCFQGSVASFTEMCPDVAAIGGKALHRPSNQGSGRLRQVSAAHRLGLGLRPATGDRTSRSRCQCERNRGGAEIIENAEQRRPRRDRGRTQLPAGDRAADGQHGRNYVLAWQDIQPTLRADGKTCLEASKPQVRTATLADDADRDQTETRTAAVSTDIDRLRESCPRVKHAAIVKMISTRGNRDEITHEIACCLLSGALTPNSFLDIVCSDCSMKNGLQWRLNVVMYRHRCCVRTGAAPKNLAILRYITPNVTREKSLRGGPTGAGLQTDYLAKLSALINNAIAPFAWMGQ